MDHKGEDTAESWERIYQEGKPGWDVGQVTPAIKGLYDEYKADWFKPGHMIVPGCGFGHEVEFFLKEGFQVTAIDFAPSAINALKARLAQNSNLTILEADMFTLKSDDLPMADFILEHTCFCAIPIINRNKYVSFIDQFLKPKGIFLGLFYKFNAEEGSGPPHPISDSEIISLFEKQFKIERLGVDENSHAKRKGNEKSFVMRRK